MSLPKKLSQRHRPCTESFSSCSTEIPPMTVWSEHARYLNNPQNLHQLPVHWVLFLSITTQSAFFTHLYPPCWFVKPTDKLLARLRDQLFTIILPETPVTSMCFLSHVLAFPGPALPQSLGILRCSSLSVQMWWPTRRLHEALEMRAVTVW